MISFKTFILAEAGDNPHSFTKDARDPETEDHRHTATYRFKVGDTNYHASVIHHSDKDAEVVFGVKRDDIFRSQYELTKDKGTKATRVLSTIHHIIKQHVADHPKMESVHFVSDIIDPSRVSLYTKYAKNMGGKTTDDEHDQYIKVHTIPTASYRSE